MCSVGTCAGRSHPFASEHRGLLSLGGCFALGHSFGGWFVSYL